jgi:hypothetical protein
MQLLNLYTIKSFPNNYLKMLNNSNVRLNNL